MIHKSSIVSCLLAAGLGITLAACGGDDPTPMNTDTYSTTIQKDLVNGGCATAGCHPAASTNKLKIDTAAGKEQANYDGMVSAGIIVKNMGDTSPLVVVPKTLKATSGATHPPVNATMTTIGRWSAWITAGAPF